MSESQLTIATRGSKLALWQAEHTKACIERTAPGTRVELLVLKTKGDKILDVPLAKVGGKGLFVKEIEEALLDGRADIAVHSMKDVPTELLGGLHMAAISERADPRDAFCSNKFGSVDTLPEGATVGTSSLRRACQLRATRPDLVIENLRGNVPTRLSKLDEGHFDAIILAVAGLERLGFGSRITEKIPTERSIPAVGQGALGIETRLDDDQTTELVRKAMHHEGDASCVLAERAFLGELEGGCQAPMACHATRSGQSLLVKGFVGTPDGTVVLRAQKTGAISEAESLGVAIAEELLAQGAGPILQALIEEAKVD